MSTASDERELLDAYVSPFYLKLLHGNFALRRPDDPDLLKSAREAAKRISDADLEALLKRRGWREWLTAAWLIGLDRRQGFVPLLSQRLLASETCFAGQGYCFALGRIGGEACAAHLRAYLKIYLPLNGREYDQLWAIGALTHIEGGAPAEFLDPVLWKPDKRLPNCFDPLQGVQDFARIMLYVDQHLLGR